MIPLEILKIVGTALITAFVTILSLVLKRKWEKDDKESSDKKDILDAIGKVDTKVDTFAVKLDEHIAQQKDDDKRQLWRDMKQVRTRILRFEADVLNPYIPYPSEGMFLQNADDENTYKAFLKSDDADGFQNSVCESAMSNIDEVFEECKKKNLYRKPKE